MQTSPSAPVAGAQSASPAEAFQPSREYALALLGREQGRALEALQAQSLAYRAALDAAPSGVCIFDAAGRVAYANRRFVEIYRLAPSEELTGALLAEIVDRQRAAGTAVLAFEEWLARAERIAARRAPEISEIALGDGRLVEVGDHPTPDGGWASLHVDLTEKAEREARAAEGRMHFIASHDSLTGLPNRALLRDRVLRAILNAARSDRWAAVAFIDLDNLKFVNHSLGHAAGDELLKAVANRLTEKLGSRDAAIRVGGDEFVIVLGDLPKNEDSARSAFRGLQSALNEPFDCDGRVIAVTSSIGAARYPIDADNADALLARADTAMYHAKDAGRDNLQFYTPDLNPISDEKLRLRDELRTAILREEFCLHYQPQIELGSGVVLAVEALIRWNHPDRGLLPPAAFIALAEQSGMIVAIGEWVVKEACRQNKAWQDAGLRPIRMCVNVSARQFRDRGLFESVEAALRESGLSAEYLELELTESMVMHDIAHAVAIMGELRRLGVQMSIDDFGTGYSSLSALKIFPVARLKIDKSFVNGLPGNADDSNVTSAVIALARNLNLKVIAEGVETAEQAAFLHSRNCDEVQGFHYSRPVPAADFATFLTRCGDRWTA